MIVIWNAPLIAGLVIGLVASSAVSAERACFDAKVQARPVDQIPSEIENCGSDCLIMSWPWFVDLRVKRVVEGALSSKMVKVLTVQHTYRVSREGTWFLRKNTAGTYNVLVPEDGSALTRCSAKLAPAEPYIRPSSEHTLDDLRNEGIRHYGHHPG